MAMTCQRASIATAALAIVIGLAPAAESTVVQAVRIVTLEIAVPTRPSPLQMSIREGSLGTIRIDGLGSFGFKPVAKDATLLRLEIYDVAQEPKLLGTSDVPIGGEVVRTKTTPEFGLRIREVREPKAR